MVCYMSRLFILTCSVISNKPLIPNPMRDKHSIIIQIYIVYEY